MRNKLIITPETKVNKRSKPNELSSFQAKKLRLRGYYSAVQKLLPEELDIKKVTTSVAHPPCPVA